jgi:hypothetical protein
MVIYSLYERHSDRRARLGKRKRHIERTIIDGKPAVGAQEAADYLSKRAAAMGIPRTYTRNAVFRLYDRGILKAAVEAPGGNLYWVEDLDKLKISPQVGRPSKKSHQTGGDESSPPVIY